VPVRAAFWEPNREPADDLGDPTGTNLRTSEMPSAPDLCVTRSGSRSGQQVVGKWTAEKEFLLIGGQLGCSQRRMLCSVL
jgi:hypothetical protein